MYAIGQPTLWPAMPDWSQPVTETLAFLTDSMQAATGGIQARALRAAPRRGFSFSATLSGDARRIADAIAFDLGVQRFVLPIYPDVQVLAAALDAGATSIPCRTAGFDFDAGGRAALWSAVDNFEVVEVASIGADALTLANPTVGAWPAGARIYPLRSARLLQPPKATHVSDEVMTLDVQCAIDEPCDWPAAWPTAMQYRTLPVLEWRNEESDSPTDQYNRLSATTDADAGKVFYTDLPGMPFRAQSQRFLLAGRDQHSAFRSLAYALNGEANTLWVPSWQADVRLLQPVGATATQIAVPWIGYTQFGYLQQNRRDIAIELLNGTRLYRRITGSAETQGHEVLQLDSALGVAVDPSQVRQIGWLSVCQLASDTISIEHDTDADGVAVATLNWQAVKADV